MGNARHTIELNGQLFDAITGERLKSATTAAMPVLDGFTVRRTPPAAAQRVTAVPVKSAVHQKKRQTPMPVKSAAKAPQRSATLMRSVVKKPQPTAAQPARHAVKKHHAAPAPRMHRAGAVNQNSLISKFGNLNRLPLKAEVTALPVQAPPISHNTAPPMDLRQQIAAVTAKVQAVNPFDHAVHQATSHQQPKVRKPKMAHRTARKLRVQPKTVRFASAVLAAFVLGGFFLYQNMPNLSMRLASTRAGVSASLPGYSPAGFSVNRHIQYSPGQITVSYHSNSDERAFSLTQKKTDLTDQTLQANVVAANGRSYQMYSDKGKTIYIYDDNNAIWVNQGVLYQIDGRSALNSDQLLRLAASI